MMVMPRGLENTKNSMAQECGLVKRVLKRSPATDHKRSYEIGLLRRNVKSNNTT